MRVRMKRLAEAGIFVAIALSCVALLLLFVSSFFSYMHVDMQGSETVFFYPARWIHYPLLAAVFFMIPTISRFLGGIREARLFLCCVICYLVIGGWIIYYASDTIRGDAAMVWQYAGLFNEGDYSGFSNGKYLCYYPFQIGLITYERLLHALGFQTKALFVYNLLWSVLTDFFLWRIAKELLDDELSRKWTILLSFLFLPHLFFTLFAYGQIPGLSCLTMGLFALIRFYKRGGLARVFMSALLIALAGQFKKNYFVGFLALMIVLLLRVMRGKELKKSLFAIVAVISLYLLADMGIRMYYEEQYGAALNKGEPLASFIGMGLQTNTEYPSAPGTNSGWENGYSFETFTESGYDTDIAAQVAMVYLREDRIPFLLSHPGYTAHLFLNKVRSTWTDPMFESVWSGPQEAFGQLSHHILLQSLYRGGHIYRILEVPMHAFVVLIYGGMLVYLIRCLRSRQVPCDAALFVVIYFLGGFIYHLMSETKSQYVFMYVYLMIPIAIKSLLLSRQRLGDRFGLERRNKGE